MKSVGIDVGGTKIEGVLLEETSMKVLKTLRVKTRKSKGPDCVSKQIALMVKKLSEGHVVEHVGVGIPGIIDQKTGVATEMTNLPGWNGFNVRKSLEEKAGRKVLIENDAVCFTLAQHGLLKKKPGIIIGLTLGTGVGGEMLVDGKPVKEKVFGFNNEMGHHVREENGRACPCGRKGCFEQYVSGPGIKKTMLELMEKGGFQTRLTRKSDSKKVFEAFKKNDELAIEVVKRTGEHLANGLNKLIEWHSPSLVAVGGSVAENFDFLMKHAKPHLNKTRTRVYRAHSRGTGAVGAALLHRKI